MQLLNVTPLKNWTGLMSSVGFGHHSFRLPYWKEEIGLQMSFSEFDILEKQITDVYRLGHQNVNGYMDYMLAKKFIDGEDYQWMKLSRNNKIMIERLDFIPDNDTYKLIDWNTQIPHGIMDAAIAQWHWSERYYPESEQFNLIQPALIESILQRKELFGVDDLGGLYQDTRIKDPLFCWDLHDIDDPINQNDMNFLKECWMNADVPVKNLYEGTAYFNENFIYDKDDIRVKYISSLAPMEGFLGTLWTRAPVLWMQSPWGLALEHKGFLAWLYDLTQNNHIAETSFSKQNSWIPKNDWTHLGAGIASESRAPIVWQKPINHKIGDIHPVFNAWFVDHKFVGLSVTADYQMIHNATSYISFGHIIQN